MYLKSIEVHGFKSFANKIVLDFHNGITGIVGPNGSGKSNVGDAVRWVLGEQSAKQLRGSSMQDVIFAGTESRKPLSYAYVAITMDNSDHVLDIDFEEVTVARRVYRSGESEYLINGSSCRLKDVHEMFYDTGIGKEGYSIIGQGQIEKILSGKPEERRELFDEAAGIVKYKKRKATAQKKLENERENLIRVNDILSELERQVAPLEKQAEKAKIYLKKKETLKTYDVNMFLMNLERVSRQENEVAKNYQVADDEMKEASANFEKIKIEYDRMGQEIENLEEKITADREALSNATVLKGKLEGQINVLMEQIHTAETSDEHFKSRMETIEADKAERRLQQESYEAQKQGLEQSLDSVREKKLELQAELKSVQEENSRCREGIENGKNEIIELLNQKANTKGKMQRFDTILEQVNIRKAQLTKRLLERKSEEESIRQIYDGYKEELDAVDAEIEELKKKHQELLQKEISWRNKEQELNTSLEADNNNYHRAFSRLESLKNIAERYDGYGNSIRKVMEQKDREKGLLGVVSDLIKVEKKYETAIETALGGSIQNIVTADEQTAKRMITYLKQNRLGRATFLPLTSVDGSKISKRQEVLRETGAIGYADTLVTADEKFKGITSYLLGRNLVVDTIDHAIEISRKFHHTINIVTLEGESLRAGGSMTGGAFRNNSNLLGRNREIEDLEKSLAELKEKLEQAKSRKDDIQTARALLADDAKEIQTQLQEKYILQNTARMNTQRAGEQKDASDQLFAGIRTESSEIEKQVQEIKAEKTKTLAELEQAQTREAEIETENEEFQTILETQSKKEEELNQALSKIQLEEANIQSKRTFLSQNMERILSELEKIQEEMKSLVDETVHAKEDVEKKKQEIEEIKKTIADSDAHHTSLDTQLAENLEKKETLSTEYKGFFQKREDISRRITELDKEIFRLNNQKEKLQDVRNHQMNYMWEEYELTPHSAIELKNEEYTDPGKLKEWIAQIKEEIRRLGDVNVNAIEDYKELSERYTFLKTQHDDLIEAEKTLLEIIEELDTGMRNQFTEKFAFIQKEFDKAFKDLFGGGKGTLELVEGEDLLECGIRIIAQPPGKKLQNMVLLSGGEKSLTAIALLFAIQNMKPSPFCLLDEIEAALDDSNVDRFAQYLHKLTENTQFIVITHRRGTMAAADRLYGITMQEKGVSTLVSVNLIENELDK